MIKYIWKIACTGILFIGLLLGSCKKDDFNTGGYFVESHTTSGMIDTVTIKVSNLVASDSVVTSGKGNGFAGIYPDPQTGVIQTQTFIEFNRTSESESNRDARFDSVMLVLRPNGNYFGDTVKRASFNVSRLMKPIEKRDNGNLYSNSIILPPDQITPLVSNQTFRVKVKDIPNNEFEIKLPKEFGEWLFKGILRDDDDFKSDKYLKTFSGLLLSAGDGSNCIHGFNLQDSACMIRIYYHISTTTRENKIMTFRANPNNSFYNLINTNPKIPIKSKSDPLPSSQTGNKGYIMSGTPMYTRLEFPHLNELLWLGNIVKIKKATLYVRPIQFSYDTVPLPPKLNIYYFDPTSNTPLSSAIRPPSVGGNTNSGPQDGNLPANYQTLLSPDYPHYTFDVTDFIASQLGKTGYDKWALCLVIPDDARESTLQRMVFGNQKYMYKNEIQSKNNQIKLEVTYAVYNE